MRTLQPGARIDLLSREPVDARHRTVLAQHAPVRVVARVRENLPGAVIELPHTPQRIGPKVLIFVCWSTTGLSLERWTIVPYASTGRVRAARVRAAGMRAGGKVSPHALRHTCVTQLLSAGCRVTSIQKLLGHRQIETTLVYARVHDRAVAEDYYSAMANIEQTVALSPATEDAAQPMSSEARAGLLQLVNQLAVPQLGAATRLDLVEQMRSLLDGTRPKQVAFAAIAQLGSAAYSSAGD